MTDRARRPGLAIFGPTSSGKTALSLDVAEALRSQGRSPAILGADSRQVYRYMDIGTSKIAPAEMRGVPHHLIDLTEPVEKFSLEQYAAAAARTLERLRADDEAVPILVGGTGTFILAMTQGWSLSGDSAQRKSLAREFPRDASAEAYRFLERLDKAAANRLSANNYEGVLNALVRAMDGGDEGTRRDDSGFDFKVIGLDPGPDTAKKRVRETFSRQLNDGLFEELLDLERRYHLLGQIRTRGRDAPNQVLHTHGYREFFDRALTTNRALSRFTSVDIAAASEDAIEHVLGYVKRQRSWFRKLDVKAVKPGARTVADVLRHL